MALVATDVGGSGAGEEAAATTLELVIVPLAGVGGVGVGVGVTTADVAVVVVVKLAELVVVLTLVGGSAVVVLLLAVDVVVLTTAPADSSDETTAGCWEPVGGAVADVGSEFAGMVVVATREAGIEEANPASVAAAAVMADDDVSIGVGPPFNCASDALSGAAEAGTEYLPFPVVASCCLSLAVVSATIDLVGVPLCPCDDLLLFICSTIAAVVVGVPPIPPTAEAAGDEWVGVVGIAFCCMVAFIVGDPAAAAAAAALAAFILSSICWCWICFWGVERCCS